MTRFLLSVHVKTINIPINNFSIIRPRNKLHTMIRIPSHWIDRIIMSNKSMNLYYIISTFLLRLRISQKHTSPSYPPDKSKWGLFLLKSTEYTYPLWAFLVRIGSLLFDLRSQLYRKWFTCISFHPAEQKQIFFHQNLTILHPILLHLPSNIESLHQDC